LFGPGPRLIKKNLPGRDLTKFEKHWFRPQKTLKKTRIKSYNSLALPVLLYGSETWTINP